MIRSKSTCKTKVLLGLTKGDQKLHEITQMATSTYKGTKKFMSFFTSLFLSYTTHKRSLCNWFPASFSGEASTFRRWEFRSRRLQRRVAEHIPRRRRKRCGERSLNLGGLCSGDDGEKRIRPGDLRQTTRGRHCGVHKLRMWRRRNQRWKKKLWCFWFIFSLTPFFCYKTLLGKWSI